VQSVARNLEGRHSCGSQPEIDDGIERAAQIAKIGVLGDVRVRVQIVGSADIGGGGGGGKHHDRYPAKMLSALDVLQHFKTILPRHIQVEKQQIRGIFREGGRLLEQVNRLIAIGRNLELVRNSGALQCYLDEAGGCSVVLGKYDAGGPCAAMVFKDQRICASSLIASAAATSVCFHKLGRSRERVWGTAYCNMNIALPITIT
jgi:hypothetical protein